MNLPDPQAPSPSSHAPRAQTPIFRAIAYGIHAPNPHNTQAWKFELVSDTEALLYIDERRLLPATDPPARQIHIGAGCCIETLAVGMSESGDETDVEYLPRGAHGLEEVGRMPVARVALRPSASRCRDDLADVIGQRQTNRKPYMGPFLSDEEAEVIRGQMSSDDIEAVILNQPEEMRPLLDIFSRAMEIEATTRHLYEETRVWFRFNESQRRAHRDGLSIPQTGTDGLKRRLTEWNLRNGNPRQWFSPRSIRPFLKTYRRGIDSARGLVLLKTKTNHQSDWLEVGRTFARVTLALTLLGLTSHPYSQVLQEFPEMAALQTEFNQLLGVREPEKIQMAVRVGRAERAYFALRRDPADFITDRTAGSDATPS
ncbi:MAG: Acg family FMN-binding oxidoreductase [Solirubrobacterales bacterium]